MENTTTPIIKTCKFCGMEKDINEFVRRGDKYRNMCKECKRESVPKVPRFQCHYIFRGGKRCDNNAKGDLCFSHSEKAAAYRKAWAREKRAAAAAVATQSDVQ